MTQRPDWTDGPTPGASHPTDKWDADVPAPAAEKSCPRTEPMKGDMGYCGEQLPSGRRLLVPHEWTDVRTDETFWCPGYWHELPR